MRMGGGVCKDWRCVYMCVCEDGRCVHMCVCEPVRMGGECVCEKGRYVCVRGEGMCNVCVCVDINCIFFSPKDF